MGTEGEGEGEAPAEPQWSIRNRIGPSRLGRSLALPVYPRRNRSKADSWRGNPVNDFGGHRLQFGQRADAETLRKLVEGGHGVAHYD